LLLTVLGISGQYNEYHRIGDLNNKHLFLRVLEARKSKIKVLVDLESGEHSNPSSQMAVLLPFPYMAKKEVISLMFLLKRILIPFMRVPPS